MSKKVPFIQHSKSNRTLYALQIESILSLVMSMYGCHLRKLQSCCPIKRAMMHYFRQVGYLRNKRVLLYPSALSV